MRSFFILLLFFYVSEVLAKTEYDYKGQLEFELSAINNKSYLNIAETKMMINASVNDDLSLNLSLEYNDFADARKNRYSRGFRAERMILQKALSPNHRHRILLGYDYIPFGLFNTFMVSDALTESLAQTQLVQMRYSYLNNGYGFKLFAANGRSLDKGDKGALNTFGMNLNLNKKISIFDTTLILGYTNNFLNFNNFKDSVIDQKVAALSSFFQIQWRNSTMIVEYIKALGKTSINDLAHENAPASLSAMNFELGHNVPIKGKKWLMAYGHQLTTDASALNLYKNAAVFVFGTAVGEDTYCKLEYKKTTDFADIKADHFYLQWTAKI